MLQDKPDSHYVDVIQEIGSRLAETYDENAYACDSGIDGGRISDVHAHRP